MRRWITIAGCIIPAIAHADHHGMVMTEGENSRSTFGAGVSLLAATYQTMTFGGDYEGIVPAGTWSMGRYAAGANMPLYRILENGNRRYGIGDFVANGQVALLLDHDVRAGMSFAVSAPTGDDMIGLGMGHLMLMPAAWAGARMGRVIGAASFGYSRALVDDASHHDHGMWPLVEPMNMSELTWSASGEVAVGSGVRTGARFAGGIPLGAMPGHERVIGVLRVAWGSGRIETAAEAQTGLVGDPFDIRGVLQTSLRF